MQKIVQMTEEEYDELVKTGGKEVEDKRKLFEKELIEGSRARLILTSIEEQLDYHGLCVRNEGGVVKILKKYH